MLLIPTEGKCSAWAYGGDEPYIQPLYTHTGNGASEGKDEEKSETAFES